MLGFLAADAFGPGTLLHHEDANAVGKRVQTPASRADKAIKAADKVQRDATFAWRRDGPRRWRLLKLRGGPHGTRPWGSRSTCSSRDVASLQVAGRSARRHRRQRPHQRPNMPHRSRAWCRGAARGAVARVVGVGVDSACDQALAGACGGGCCRRRCAAQVQAGGGSCRQAGADAILWLGLPNDAAVSFRVAGMLAGSAADHRAAQQEMNRWQENGPGWALSAHWWQRRDRSVCLPQLMLLAPRCRTRWMHAA